MRLAYRFLLICYCCVCCLSNQSSTNTAIQDFVPTNEWQVILPGQAIPRGIHVRHNFETGLTEGKVMDHSEKPAEKNSLIVGGLDTLTEKSNLRDTLHTGIQHADKNDYISSADHSRHSHKMDVKLDRTAEFRTIEQIKEAYEKLHVSFKTDSEIMKELFDEYENTSSEARKLIILEDLADYLHQYDNAINFADNGSLARLLSTLMSVSSDFKVAILRCLTAAMQGNPKVKVNLFKVGILNELVQIWHEEISFADHPNALLISQCLSTLSSLLRKFPLPQNIFFGLTKNDNASVGFQLLSKTIKSPLWYCYTQSCRILKLRIVSLVGELVHERHSQDKSSPAAEQYSGFDLASAVRLEGWCAEMVTILMDEQLLVDHTSRQRALVAALSLAEGCSATELFPPDLHNSKQHRLKAALGNWLDEYSRLSANEDVSDGVAYFAQMHSLVSKFRELVIVKDLLKTEL